MFEPTDSFVIYKLGFLVAAVCYGALAAAVALSSRGRLQALLLAGAFAVQGLWAAGISVEVAWLLPAVPHLDFARALIWILFFASVMAQERGSHVRTATLVVLGLAVCRAGAILLMGWDFPVAWQAVLAIDMVADMFVLAAIAVALRHSGETPRWRLKYLCLPLAGLFAYELFVTGQIIGLGMWSPEMSAIRGLLHVLALPFFVFGAVRARLWRERIAISHQGALYSTALIASGIYLVLIAAAAMAIGALAPEHRLPLQVTFLFAAVLMFFLLLSSGAVRAHAKAFIARNFFTRKYDYLHEWQRLLHTLGDQSRADPLETRIVQAVADVVEAPGGALFVLEGSQPRLVGSWNFSPARPPGLQAGSFRTSEGVPRVLEGTAENGMDDTWLAVPLPRGGDVIGFVALSRPRAGRRLEPEDRQLLIMAAEHCASYLAEQRQALALAESRQFERFTRQYAFVVHDIKNIMSQLSLMLKNFERHGHKPAFREDMMETVGNAVDRMQTLTTRIQDLKAGGDTENKSEYDLVELLKSEVARFDAGESGRVALGIAPGAKDACVRVPRERFLSTVGHLVSNGLEAIGQEGTVRVEADATDSEVVIDIVDHGPGMTAEFVAEELFRPFRSTKNQGFGLGAYQCRAFAREQGGDLDVVTSPSAGTTMRLRLPRVRNDHLSQQRSEP